MKNSISKILLILFLLANLFPFNDSLFSLSRAKADDQSYTINPPEVEAYLVGEDQDTAAMQVFWNMPDGSEPDAYGFILCKAGPVQASAEDQGHCMAGQAEAANYYPSASGFEDLTDSGYYYDEAVAEGDTYTYYVKAYDRSGVESEFSSASKINVEFPFNISNGTVNADYIKPSGDYGVKIDWSTDKESHSLVEFGLTDNYGQKVNEDSPDKNSTHTAFIPTNQLDPWETYHFRLKAYMSDEEPVGDSNATLSDDQTFYYNPCSIGFGWSGYDGFNIYSPNSYETYNLNIAGGSRSLSGFLWGGTTMVYIDGLSSLTNYPFTLNVNGGTDGPRSCGKARTAPTDLTIGNDPAHQDRIDTNSANIYFHTSGSVGITKVTYREDCDTCQPKYANASSNGENHHLSLSGLLPNRRYNYQVVFANDGLTKEYNGYFVTYSSIWVSQYIIKEERTYSDDSWVASSISKKLKITTNKPVRNNTLILEYCDYDSCAFTDVNSASINNNTWFDLDSNPGRQYAEGYLIYSVDNADIKDIGATILIKNNDPRYSAPGHYLEGLHYIYQMPAASCDTERDSAGRPISTTCTANYDGPSWATEFSFNINSSGVTSSGANMNWDTAFASEDTLEYGTSTAYGQTATATATNPNRTSHQVQLTGLAGNTVYHYRIKSHKDDGTDVYSSDHTFTTTPDPDAALALSIVSETPTKVNLHWQANQPMTGKIQFGESSPQGFKVYSQFEVTDNNPDQTLNIPLPLSILNSGALDCKDPDRKIAIRALGHTATDKAGQYSVASTGLNVSRPTFTIGGNANFDNQTSQVSGNIQVASCPPYEMYYGFTSAKLHSDLMSNHAGVYTAIGAQDIDLALDGEGSGSFANLPVATYYGDISDDRYPQPSLNITSLVSVDGQINPSHTSTETGMVVIAANPNPVPHTLSFDSSGAPQITFTAPVYYPAAFESDIERTVIQTEYRKDGSDTPLGSYSYRTFDSGINTILNYDYPTIDRNVVNYLDSAIDSFDWQCGAEPSQGLWQRYGKDIGPTGSWQRISGAVDPPARSVLCPKNGNRNFIREIVVSDITPASATISWQTETASNSTIEYGLDSSYGQTATVIADEAKLHHSANLSNLSANTDYHFRIKSTRQDGTAFVSADNTFKTQNIYIRNIDIADITDNSANITWETTENVLYSDISYSDGTNTYNMTGSQVSDNGQNKQFNAWLADLTPDTDYSFYISATALTDPPNSITVQSDESSFRTEMQITPPDNSLKIFNIYYAADPLAYYYLSFTTSRPAIGTVTWSRNGEVFHTANVESQGGLMGNNCENQWSSESGDAVDYCPLTSAAPFIYVTINMCSNDGSGCAETSFAVVNRSGPIAPLSPSCEFDLRGGFSQYCTTP